MCEKTNYSLVEVILQHYGVTPKILRKKKGGREALWLGTEALISQTGSIPLTAVNHVVLAAAETVNWWQDRGYVWQAGRCVVSLCWYRFIIVAARWREVTCEVEKWVRYGWKTVKYFQVPLSLKNTCRSVQSGRCISCLTATVIIITTVFLSYHHALYNLPPGTVNYRDAGNAVYCG